MNKNLFKVVLIIIIQSCSKNSGQEVDRNLEQFNNFLGQQKSGIFNQLVGSFDKFLNVNFPEENGTNEQVRAFLIKIENCDNFPSDLIFDTKTDKEIYDKYESSGLRKEIELYGYENYNMQYDLNKLDLIKEARQKERRNIAVLDTDSLFTIDIINEEDSNYQEEEYNNRYDSILNINPHGMYLYGLAKYAAPADSIILDYVQAMSGMDLPEYYLLIEAYLKLNLDFTNPFYKRMLVVDFYTPLIRLDMERKGILKK